ncbi:MAG TPA: HAD family hydrolase, partial [Solirubrobacteraceae bacterium]
LEPPGPRLVEGLARDHGIELEREDAERAFGAEILYYRAHHLQGRDGGSLADLRMRCAGVLREGLPRPVKAAISQEQLLRVMLDCLHFNVFADVRPALMRLREEGLLLVVVSNWDISLRATLTDAGLADLLDDVLSSAEAGHQKPQRAIFDAALQRAGVASAQAIHVGDSSELDVDGASSAGLAVVLLRRDRADGSEPGDGGTPVISSLEQLPALVA